MSQVSFDTLLYKRAHILRNWVHKYETARFAMVISEEEIRGPPVKVFGPDEENGQSIAGRTLRILPHRFQLLLV
jgi:hypothetical protein